MGNYGVKIAKSGYSVNSPSLGDYIYHSSYPLLKIKLIQKSSFVYSDSKGTTKTIYHGLGYPPLFDAYMKPTNSSTRYRQIPYRNYCGVGMYEIVNVYVDNNNLYIYVSGLCGYAERNSIPYFVIIYYDPFD